LKHAGAGGGGGGGGGFRAHICADTSSSPIPPGWHHHCRVLLLCRVFPSKEKNKEIHLIPFTNMEVCLDLVFFIVPQSFVECPLHPVLYIVQMFFPLSSPKFAQKTLTLGQIIF
jgi:hypothetical protein